MIEPEIKLTFGDREITIALAESARDFPDEIEVTVVNRTTNSSTGYKIRAGGHTMELLSEGIIGGRRTAQKKVKK